MDHRMLLFSHQERNVKEHGLRGTHKVTNTERGTHTKLKAKLHTVLITKDSQPPTLDHRKH